MTKYRLIIPTCCLLASGCALFDDPEPPTMATTVSVAAVRSEPVAHEPALEIDQKLVEPPAATPRIFAKNDIRRLQARLRDIGLDPGPIDGIAGARTKAAYVRLHTGCSQVGPLIDSLHGPITVGQSVSSNTTTHKLPGLEETRNIQSQLRSAGFDPGPVDGIFGRKTKSMISRLQTGCLMAKQFDAMLADQSSLAAKNSELSSVTSPVSTAASGQQRFTAPAGHDTPPAMAATAPSGSREDIRILQLRLRDAGFDPGPFDGIMGPKTRSALKRYEASERGKKTKTSLTTPTVTGQY